MDLLLNVQINFFTFGELQFFKFKILLLVQRSIPAFYFTSHVLIDTDLDILRG